MGNHEYCEDCGANSFHFGSPCDPEGVLKVKERKREEEKEKCFYIIKAFLDINKICDCSKYSSEIDIYDICDNITVDKLKKNISKS
jgi:hypothetical protein